ncbi:hypothetical protein [Phenylobacterium sp.]|uniref:hypothetical protein n=1 Tax=Phenylobacterium sp. TaxID=1871053 RepID=UPI00122A0FFA|nr:hypothetical protein [Phenylobacterium sp.]TAL30796.1 MAG: hypothetical protein EPN98_16640 [Phenylobacterium sp.]
MSRVAAPLSLTAALVAAAAPTRAEPLAAPVEGPARICFHESGFELAAGERITDFSGGIHAASVTVSGPHGGYTVTEGEIFVTPRGMGLTVYRTPKFHIRRDGQRYAVFAATSFSPDERRLLIWLSGPALARAHRKAIFQGIWVGDPATAKCDQGFGYGWNFLDQ